MGIGAESADSSNEVGSKSNSSSSDVLGGGSENPDESTLVRHINSALNL